MRRSRHMIIKKAASQFPFETSAAFWPLLAALDSPLFAGAAAVVRLLMGTTKRHSHKLDAGCAVMSKQGSHIAGTYLVIVFCSSRGQ